MVVAPRTAGGRGLRDIFLAQGSLSNRARRVQPRPSLERPAGRNLLPQRPVEDERPERHDRRDECVHGAADRPSPNAARAIERRQEDDEEHPVDTPDDADRERLIGEIFQRHRDEQQHEERRALEEGDESKLAQCRHRDAGFISPGRAPSECRRSDGL